MKAGKLKKLFADLSKYTDDVVPITENLNLEAGTVFTQGIQKMISFDFDHDVSGSIDFGRFKKFIATVPNTSDIGFEESGENIAVTVNGVKEAFFPSELLIDLPEIHKPVEEKGVFPIGVLNLEDLEKVKESLICVGHDELRPAMTNVYLGKNIYSTDGHRLYFNSLSEGFMTGEIEPEYVKTLDKEAMGDKYYERMYMTSEELAEFTIVKAKERDHILIPYNTAQMMVKHKLPCEVTVYFPFDKVDCSKGPGGKKVAGKPWVKITNGEFTIYEQTCEERYPDVNSVIPDQVNTNHFKSTFVLSEFARTVKSATVMANTTTHQIKLRLGDKEGKAVLMSRDLDYQVSYNKEIKAVTELVHRQKTKVVVNSEGEEDVEPVNPEMFDSIGFNGRFMTIILNEIKGMEVTLKFWAPNRAMIINDKYLLMPVML